MKYLFNGVSGLATTKRGLTMQYRKAGMARMVLLALALLLTGCKDKGKAFVGHWVEITNNEHPTDMKITYDNGVFHIDKNEYYALGLADYKLKKLEATAKSDNVLTVMDRFGKTMRLNDGVISFDNAEFKKQD
ncbi:hypothetical protein REG_1659 [Candidatus Regiella insecticola LSR1]|uniref:Uncharacterized protein n=3 Tax=Enterobacterales TaxID=91347 RepID=E0WU89_9ENTR|nr:hypothetical protein [Candidatus Fukatsuia symbiotica]AWK15629.1 hypothetical protein CCS41_14540 [Candidatus Fukatsuia symbiotica]EFL91429.1 hypothetical protein REG_1659 [Candidatus Regiella insecticola LSR1]MEA9446209.1 hypothetical protein [Candidatus Fukatsuia symbiotica]